MIFGDQTVGFVTVADGALDELGIPAKVRTIVDVTGCHFRPLTIMETITWTDVATEVWKCTAPPLPAVLGATVVDELIHDGVTYQIIGGPRPYTDFTTAVIKVTVLCQRQVS